MATPVTAANQLLRDLGVGGQFRRGSSIGIQVVGLGALTQALASTRVALRNQEKNMRDVVDLLDYRIGIEARAAKFARRTGGVEDDRDVDVKSTARGVVGTIHSADHAFYWVFLEQGTERFTADPFVDPALEGSEEEIDRILGRPLDLLI